MLHLGFHIMNYWNIKIVLVVVVTVVYSMQMHNSLRSWEVRNSMFCFIIILFYSNVHQFRMVLRLLIHNQHWLCVLYHSWHTHISQGLVWVHTWSSTVTYCWLNTWCKPWPYCSVNSINHAATFLHDLSSRLAFTTAVNAVLYIHCTILSTLWHKIITRSLKLSYTHSLPSKCSTLHSGFFLNQVMSQDSIMKVWFANTLEKLAFSIQ